MNKIQFYEEETLVYEHINPVHNFDDIPLISFVLKVGTLYKFVVNGKTELYITPQKYTFVSIFPGRIYVCDE